jgi:hypothetical protein
MSNTPQVRRNVSLTAQEAEFLLGSLDALVKAKGLPVAASVLHVGTILENAFKEEEEVEVIEAPKAKAKK